MNSPLRLTAALLAAGLLGPGCSYYDSHTIAYVGAPRPAPTTPAQIELIHAPPTRAHERLGEIVVDTSLEPPPSIQKVEARFRREAAKLGADAVFIVQDQAQTTGWWTTGPWWSPSVSSLRSRVIVGVALKYQ